MLAILSPDEIKALTGYTQPAKQMRWLKDNGYPFELGGDGRPKVLEQLVLSRLGGTQQRTKAPQLRLTG